MKISISSDLQKEFSQYKEGILIVKGIDNNMSSDYSYQYLCHEMDNFRHQYATSKLENLYALSPWLELFEKVGIKSKNHPPSHVALIQRIMEPQDLPNINPIVNIINAIQIKYGVPIGAHDLDKIDGDIVVGKNSDQKDFIARSTSGTPEVESVDANEIVHSDDKNVLTRRWCWRQGNKDLTDRDSKNVLFFINTLDLSPEQVEEIASEILGALSKFAKYDSANFEILGGQNNTVTDSSMKELKREAEINLFTKEISRDREIIDRILEKAVEEILTSKDQLEAMLLSGRRIKVYQGFDPTADTLHIGHTVMMRKLEDFRKLGHQVFFLIGDFTARIGDPTDKKSARKKLTPEEVNINLKKYVDQAKAIIDIENADNPVSVVFNNDWLGSMSFQDVMELASNFTVQQMMKRSMFQERIKEDQPIYVHEFMYPMMQGWDSVSMQIDVELGGNDQLFNMVAGRDLVMSHLRKQKFVVAGKLLTTADGRKMGKSEGNMIKLSDSATDIYGKVMAFPDEHIAPGFELLTSASLQEVAQYAKTLETASVNPIELKKELALRISSELKTQKEAEDAEQYFESVFQNNEVANIELQIIDYNDKISEIVKLVSQNIDGSVASGSEVRRLISQGAVSINDTVIKDIQEDLSKHLSPEGEFVIKVGKKIARVKKIQ